MNFPLQIFFNDGYRAAILKKGSLWLLQLYMVVATYFYYEKVRIMMYTAIVSNLKLLPYSLYVKIRLHYTTLYYPTLYM